MACGTPVIAMRRGSVPEVIEDGVSGFIVEDEDEAVQAIGRLDELDRRRVRDAFERRFTASRMAAEYVRCYQRVIGSARRHDQIGVTGLGHNSYRDIAQVTPQQKVHAVPADLSKAVCPSPGEVARPTLHE
jgi:hypothetical protein